MPEELNNAFVPDELDQQIIELLREDGRMSTQDVAKRLGSVKLRAIYTTIMRWHDTMKRVAEKRSEWRVALVHSWLVQRRFCQKC